MEAWVRQGRRLVLLADGEPELETTRVSNAGAEDDDRLLTRGQNLLHGHGDSQLVFGWRHPGLAHKRSRRHRRRIRTPESVEVTLPPGCPGRHKNGPDRSRVAQDPAAQHYPPSGDPVHQPAAFVSFSSRSTIEDSVANAAPTGSFEVMSTPAMRSPSSGYIDDALFKNAR